jgi:hypothetical protein
MNRNRTGCPRMSGQDPGRHYIWSYEANRIPTTCGPRLSGAPLWDSLRSTRRLRVAAGSESLISSAGGALLIETAAAVGLDQALSDDLRPWRGRRARHDPGKVLLDLAVAVALGGDCLADLCCRARAARPVRPRGIRPDRVAVGGRACRRRTCRAGRGAPGPGRGPRTALAAVSAGRARRAADRGLGRHYRAGALGEGRRHPDVETHVRVPPAAGARSSAGPAWRRRRRRRCGPPGRWSAPSSTPALPWTGRTRCRCWRRTRSGRTQVGRAQRLWRRAHRRRRGAAQRRGD